MPRFTLALLFGAGALLTLLNASRAIHCGQPTGCVDRYWASIWLLSYDEGYTRRALLGQLVRWLSGVQLHYLALNALSFAVGLLILTSVHAQYFRARKRGEWQLVFIAALSGPTTTVVFEVLGDPLQASFLVVLLYAWMARRTSGLPSIALAVLSVLCVTMIHEASTFHLRASDLPDVLRRPKATEQPGKRLDRHGDMRSHLRAALRRSTARPD